MSEPRERLPLLLGLVLSIAMHATVLVPLLATTMSSQGVDQSMVEAVPDPQPTSSPPPDPDEARLGIESSKASTMTWIGYEKYQEHLAALSQIDQPQLSIDPASAPVPASEPSPPVVLIDESQPPSPPPPAAAPASPPTTPPDVEPAPAPETTPAATPLPDSQPVAPPAPAPPVETGDEPITIKAPASEPKPAAAPAQPEPPAALQAPVKSIGLIPPEGLGKLPITRGAPDELLPSMPDPATSPDPTQPPPVTTEPPDEPEPTPEGNSKPEQATPNENDAAPQLPPDEDPAADQPANPATPPDSQPPSAAKPNPGHPGKPGSPGTPGAPADKESDAFSTIRVPPETWKNGRPLAAHGLDIQTRKPYFSLLTMLTASPGNPLFEIQFRRDGKPAFVKPLERSGDFRIDDALVSCLYRWRAKGEALSKLGENETLNVKMRIVLVNPPK